MQSDTSPLQCQFQIAERQFPVAVSSQFAVKNALFSFQPGMAFTVASQKRQFPVAEVKA